MKEIFLIVFSEGKLGIVGNLGTERNLGKSYLFDPDLLKYIDVLPLSCNLLLTFIDYTVSIMVFTRELL